MSLAMLGIVAALVLMTFQDYGLSWDEEGLDQYGRLLLSWYTSGFKDRSAFGFANLYYYGGGFSLLANICNYVSPFGQYETRHLLGGIIGLIGLAGTWRLGRRLGGPRTGFLAVLILALAPRYYGHMFINHKDLPFGVGMVWTTLFLTRVITEFPRLTAGTIAGLGLAGGLTLGTRINGLIFFGYLAPPLFLWFITRRSKPAGSGLPWKDLGRGLLALLPAGLIMYLVMGLIWPWAWQGLWNPILALTMFSRFPFDGQVLFNGQLYPAQNLPGSYLPAYLAISQPEPFLIGLGLGLAWLVWKIRREPSSLGRPEAWVWLVAILAALVPLVYCVLMRPPLYNGIRHFLFILPPLSVLAGAGFDRLLALVSGRGRLLVVGLMAALFFWTAAIMVELHPYQYVYHNTLTGGVKGAEGRYELDYWGTSLAEATRRLTAALNLDGATAGRPWSVYVCGPALAAAYYFPSFLTLTAGRETADFEAYLAQFYCRPRSKGRRLVEVRRLGALLSAVDDYRPVRAGQVNTIYPARP
ncbi:MAG: glycosyltransferase family 39 protein [Thermodesulfobacteriota bacterium]